MDVYKKSMRILYVYYQYKNCKGKIIEHKSSKRERHSCETKFASLELTSDS